MSQNITPPPLPSHPPARPPRKNTTAIIISAAAAVVAAIIGSVIIANSGSDSSDAAPVPTVTVTVTTTAKVAAEEEGATPTPTHGTDFKAGEEARNGGAVVKISKVMESNTIALAGAQKAAGSDAKYVSLKTTVSNEGKSSMDLTCSLPIVNALIDDQGRRFDTIEDLYDVAGNPECNAQLQPGFKDEMLFVYRVPKDAKIALWEFEEYDLESEPNPTLVDLT
ncbi:hypothetical protein [Streptomyces regalis]|uniref:DUF4352 domain-containing protein n=1 Tax=Streptomyces regalis TaxID=68262 RepID=A0A0X3VH33_9ACTN|nr:hypothetical protein [Streptomyces regalis]KUL43914.1 hypothetical protein ADL12_06635 [Streptomyces regalis]